MKQWREWFALTVGILIITVGAELLIRAAIKLGDLLDTPSFLWGLTLVAIATSVPDLFISVAAARRERFEASLANAIGSNVFDLLVAVPLGVLFVGAVAVDMTITMPLFLFLVIVTVLALILMRNDHHVSRGDAYIMLALYGGFVAWLMWISMA